MSKMIRNSDSIPLLHLGLWISHSWCRRQPNT
jgi:hypothetical protein